MVLESQRGLNFSKRGSVLSGVPRQKRGVAEWSLILYINTSCDCASIAGDRKYRIPNLNPLTLYNFQVDSGSRTVGIKLVFKEAYIHGLAEADIKATRLDLNKKHVEFDILFPHFYITGDYDISGRVLVLPIQGKGPANITLSKWLSFNPRISHINSVLVVFEKSIFFFDFRLL